MEVRVRWPCSEQRDKEGRVGQADCIPKERKSAQQGANNQVARHTHTHGGTEGGRERERERERVVIRRDDEKGNGEMGK